MRTTTLSSPLPLLAPVHSLWHCRYCWSPIPPRVWKIDSRQHVCKRSHRSAHVALVTFFSPLAIIVPRWSQYFAAFRNTTVWVGIFVCRGSLEWTSNRRASQLLALCFHSPHWNDRDF